MAKGERNSFTRTAVRASDESVAHDWERVETDLAADVKLRQCAPQDHGDVAELSGMPDLKAETLHVHNALMMAIALRRQLLKSNHGGIVRRGVVRPDILVHLANIGRVMDPQGAGYGLNVRPASRTSDACEVTAGACKTDVHGLNQGLMLLPSLQSLVDWCVGFRARAGAHAQLGGAAIVGELAQLTSIMRSQVLAEDQNYKRRTRDNMERARLVVKSAFEARARVLLIRVDLGVVSDTQMFHWWERPSRDVELFSEARTVFHKRLKERYGLGLLGYLWRLEFGHQRGFHLHYYILLDGSLHQRDGKLALTIGGLWKTALKPGVGSFYSPHGNEQAYIRRGIGMASSYEDVEDGVEYIIQYFLKQDYFFHAYAKNHRSFGTSRPFQRKNGSGRPRKKKAVEA